MFIYFLIQPADLEMLLCIRFVCIFRSNGHWIKYNSCLHLLFQCLCFCKNTEVSLLSVDNYRQENKFVTEPHALENQFLFSSTSLRATSRNSAF